MVHGRQATIHDSKYGTTRVLFASTYTAKWLKTMYYSLNRWIVYPNSQRKQSLQAKFCSWVEQIQRNLLIICGTLCKSGSNYCCRLWNVIRDKPGISDRGKNVVQNLLFNICGARQLYFYTLIGNKDDWLNHDLDWDSQSLYTAAILDWIEGQQNKQKKVSGLLWNSTTTEHAHLCPICPTTILIGPFQSTAWNLWWNMIVTPRHVPRHTLYSAAWIPDALERDSAHVYLCAHF